MEANIVVLPGDGIGPEVTVAAVSVVETIADRFGHFFSTHEHLIGGIAIDQYGDPLPQETLSACRHADAVLLGAVGGPKWDNPSAAIRPEQGLLGLRKSLDLYANLRPVRTLAISGRISPLKADRLQDVDMIVVRELTGGIYFGEPRGRRLVGGEVQAVDSMVYSEHEIERVSRLAFELAMRRSRKVTSVDKANVLECSRLWREVVTRVSKDYPEVVLEHILVDSAAMFLISKPSAFDVILTENMFGDILTDEASVLAGSMGLLPSASLGGERNRLGFQFGLYEPIHGSAPDLAGKGIANPIGAILSAALLLRYSLGLEEEARVVEYSVLNALAINMLTIDLAESGTKSCTTAEFTNLVNQEIISSVEKKSAHAR